ncbi:MAG: aminomethyl-transferring glycine dehydrogenase subunit GcvPA [Bacillota bacterium]|nr:aminomethyl-transferring glycine dehydrogenase [Bacillota bacterium]REJ33962.1 MAG: aminomethyl-transferring glycine dehydrogenase subunit GcvPA [Bacillota bacterium]
MTFAPMTDAEREAMLAAIGVKSVDELFADIPAEIRLNRPLDLPPALSEAEVRRHLSQLAGRNADVDRYTCFLGAGAYDHLIPAAVGQLVSRSEFYTSYTPYQPEITQGVLQATYEYQTMIATLTGMDLANASVYDGATALAEGALLACAHTGRDKVVIPTAVHPEYRQVTHTYLRHQGLEVVEVPYRDGVTPLSEIKARVDARTAAVVVQQPNFFGSMEDVAAIAEVAREAGALVIVAIADPLTLGLLKPPGAAGAHIAVGEGQALGNNLSFGGPYLGFLAVRQELVRRIPGRIVGATVDRDGNRGFVLTLQTREQHIRREKATSNICTNQALNAITAAVYLSLLGKQGVRDVATQCVQKAHYLQRAMTALPAFSPAWGAPFFHEFVVRTTADPEELSQRLLEHQIIGGLPLGRFYPELSDCMLWCVTESRTREEMDRLVAVLEGLT